MTDANTRVPTMDVLGRPLDGDPTPRTPHTTFDWKDGFPRITCIIDDPTAAETLAFRHADVRLSFLLEEQSLWAFMLIPGAHEASAPFSPHLVHPVLRRFSPLETPETRYSMTMLMADANSAVVQAIRFGTISTECSAYMHRAAASLLKRPFDTQSHSLSIDAFYDRHRREGPLLFHLGEVSCTLGD